MATLLEAIAWFRMNAEAHPDPEINPLPLGSTVAEPAMVTDVRAAWQQTRIPCLLDPAASAAATATARALQPENLRDDDVVIGEFLGCGDLLVLAPSEGGDRQVLVAEELKPAMSGTLSGTAW